MKGFQDRYEFDLSVVPHGLTTGLVAGYRALSPRGQDANVDWSDSSIHISRFGVIGQGIGRECCFKAGFESIVFRCVRLQLKVKWVLYQETERRRA